LQSYQLATTIANFLMLASLDANRDPREAFERNRRGRD